MSSKNIILSFTPAHPATVYPGQLPTCSAAAASTATAATSTAAAATSTAAAANL